MTLSYENWKLSVRKLSTLLGGIKSKYHGDFYCLIYLLSFRKENKLNYHEKLCYNKSSCRIVMLTEKIPILEFKQYMRPDKMPYIIYADIQSLIQKNRWMCKQSRKIFNSKNRWAYYFWIFNVNNLEVWSHRRQTHFISWKIL